MPGLKRPQHLQHRLRRGTLQRPVRAELLGQHLRLSIGARREHIQQIGHPRLLRPVVPHLGSAVRDGPHDLLPHHIRLIEQIDDARRLRMRLPHLRGGVLQIHHPRRDPWLSGPGHGEDRSVPLVEPLRQIPGELDMLRLVLADGHLMRAIGEDVGRHQRRIGEQRQSYAPPSRLLPHGLLLVLDHPPHLAVGGRALHEIGQPHVLIHLALDEERALLGVEPRGQQQRGGLAGEPPHPRRVVFDRERVQIDDAEQRVGTVLVLLNPPAYGPEVVAEGQMPTRFDPTEDPAPCRLRLRHLSAISRCVGTADPAGRASRGGDANGRRSGGRGCACVDRGGRRQAAHHRGCTHALVMP
ncbi:hypothetical protein SANTM175S_01610 [Streptomyces antimycoticus]